MKNLALSALYEGELAMRRVEEAARTHVPIPTSEMKPSGDALLLTASKMWIIGDWYQGAWRTHRSRWEERNGKQVLISAYREEDITHWLPLPDAISLLNDAKRNV